jgi:kumamolisin
MTGCGSDYSGAFRNPQMITRPTPACLLFACLAFLNPVAVAANAVETRPVAGSVRLPDPGGQTMGRARIVRALTADELSAPMSFSVSLRMRDFAGLEARIARGEQIPFSEMEARYLPLRSDFDSVAAWLEGQGFTRTLQDRVHMNVFVRGPVAMISQAFGVQFARVAVPDGDYTSAVSEPSVPADLAPAVLRVGGLQPEFRLRHLKASVRLAPNDAVGNFLYVTPDNLDLSYNIPATATGAGQIIAVVGEAPVVTSDLTTFWRTTGVAQVPSNVTTIDVGNGPAANPDNTLSLEACLDVEWASAIAPAAEIRLYVSQNAFDCFAQILNDLPGFPGLTVISSSYGNTEANYGTQALQEFSQVAATFAAAGVSVLASSGDAGSNPDTSVSEGQYLSSAPLGVSYPASDPNVTGVGGTTINYVNDWNYMSEFAWDDITASASATGGGVSSYFSKPSWQTGGSVLAGQAMRCVPDVAAISTGNLSNVDGGNGPDGVLIFQNGTAGGASGTSLSAPVWAAVAALINQARATAGLGPIGLLNPHLYPLATSSAFHDVTSGTNGNYRAGPGYDLCTGLGSPDVVNLLADLTGVAPSQRLANISARAEVETGGNVLIAGFVIRGPAGSSKNILVRGIGPALGGFGVTGFLANPIVGVYDSSSTLIASDTGWSNAPVAGTSTSAATFRQATATDMSNTGAFSLTAGAFDSAMVLTLPVGSYTVEVSGAGSTTGVALAEVYELDGVTPGVLENISSRSFVGTGAQAAIPGFVVKGSQPVQLLIRGVGPGLIQFGLTGTLAQPSISVYDQSNVLIASDTGWGNAPAAGTSTVAATYRLATAADMQALGAFALTAGSSDSAIVVTLPPGNYTAIVSGVGQTTGTALAEVYQVN